MGALTALIGVDVVAASYFSPSGGGGAARLMWLHASPIQLPSISGEETETSTTFRAAYVLPVKFAKKMTSFHLQKKKQLWKKSNNLPLNFKDSFVTYIQVLTSVWEYFFFSKVGTTWIVQPDIPKAWWTRTHTCSRPTTKPTGSRFTGQRWSHDIFVIPPCKSSLRVRAHVYRCLCLFITTAVL